MSTPTKTSVEMPEVGYLGDDASYGYDADDMRSYGDARARERDEFWRGQVERLRKALEQTAALLPSVSEALLVGRDYANQVLSEYQISMGDFRKERQEYMRAEIRQLDAAIESVDAAIAALKGEQP